MARIDLANIRHAYGRDPQDEADFKANAVNNGASGVLAKPPVVEELEEILEHAAQPRAAAVEHEAVETLAASGKMDEVRNMLESLAGQFSTLARKLERLEWWFLHAASFRPDAHILPGVHPFRLQILIHPCRVPAQ